MENLSPFLVLCGMFCVPWLIIAAVSFYVGRNGSPVSVAWRGPRLRGKRRESDVRFSAGK